MKVAIQTTCHARTGAMSYYHRRGSSIMMIMLVTARITPR